MHVKTQSQMKLCLEGYENSIETFEIEIDKIKGSLEELKVENDRLDDCLLESEERYAKMITQHQNELKELQNREKEWKQDYFDQIENLKGQISKLIIDVNASKVQKPVRRPAFNPYNLQLQDQELDLAEISVQNSPETQPLQHKLNALIKQKPREKSESSEDSARAQSSKEAQLLLTKPNIQIRYDPVINLITRDMSKCNSQQSLSVNVRSRGQARKTAKITNLDQKSNTKKRIVK